MTTATLHTREGRLRKAEAFDLLEQWRDWLIQRARRALLVVLLERGTATIDDVRDLVPVPAGVNPKAFGPVPGELAAAGIIAAVGFAKTRRPKAHARPVQVWRLVNRAAAMAWLRTHPELPEPEDDDADDEGDSLFRWTQNDAPGAATPGGR